MSEVTDMTRGVYRFVYSTSWIEGKRINAVSEGAELLFLRLNLIADDLGNCDGDPEKLRAKALPLRPRIKTATVAKWLDELATVVSPATGRALIQRYTSGGELYLHIDSFKEFQPTRRGRNGKVRVIKKVPEWPGESGDGVTGCVQVHPENPESSKRPHTHSDSHSDSDTHTPQPPGGACPGFERFWEKWPTHHRKEDKAACLRKWKQFGCELLTEAVLDGLDRWIASEDWKKEGGRFISAPHPWLNKRRWSQYPPPAKADAKFGTRTVAMGAHT